MRKQSFEGSLETFFKSPVSRIVPKNVEGGPFGIFRTSTLLQTRKKLKGDPSETLKKNAEKVSQSRNNMHKKRWSMARLEPTYSGLAALNKPQLTSMSNVSKSCSLVWHLVEANLLSL